jgi:hypothetical protein
MGGMEKSEYQRLFLLAGVAVPVMTRRPGASLANPNKAAHKITAVEFVSDRDDAWRVFYFRPGAVLVNGGCIFWAACVRVGECAPAAVHANLGLLPQE